MPRLTAVCLLLIIAQTSVAHSAQPPSPADTAAAIDQIIATAEEDAIAAVDDATFLRRVSLDLIGRPASLGEITMFGLDPSPQKRSRLVNRLLNSDEYATNWSRYWKESIFKRATNGLPGLKARNPVRAAFGQQMWNRVILGPGDQNVLGGGIGFGGVDFGVETPDRINRPVRVQNPHRRGKSQLRPHDVFGRNSQCVRRGWFAVSGVVGTAQGKLQLRHVRQVSNMRELLHSGQKFGEFFTVKHHQRR